MSSVMHRPGLSGSLLTNALPKIFSAQNVPIKGTNVRFHVSKDNEVPKIVFDSVRLLHVTWASLDWDR